jgi:hypothetical protein
LYDLAPNDYKSISNLQVKHKISRQLSDYNNLRGKGADVPVDHAED